MNNNMRNVVWSASLCLVLALTLASCSFPGMVSTSAQLPVVRQTPQTHQLSPIHFPQDEGAHNNLTEWWYYTGHLQASDASGASHTYGFELVIFQALRSDIPPVYTAHFAISDVTRGEFHYDQRRLLEPVPIPDGTSTKGIDVQVGDWRIQGQGGQDHLVANMQNYGIDLHLSGLKPATLHNSNGLISLGLAGFSYYYSRTRMAVSGTLTDHQHPLHVTGLAWMDHQWGDFLTLGGGGWDWFSMQLRDNTEMMLYFVRDASGAVLSTYIDYVDSSGNDHIIVPTALKATSLATWTSPATGITYPSGWRVGINAPLLHTTLSIIPQLRNQELDARQSTGNVYWEGAVTIQGQSNDNAIAGEGYVELTGYHK
jgi:predicted secreted hydrolase